MPISWGKQDDGRTLASYAFIDDGQCSLSAFEHWLSLCCALPSAEIVFVCDTKRNVSADYRASRKSFPQGCDVSLSGYLLDYEYPP